MHSCKNIYIIRHGQTQWSLEGKHTGLTDIALTSEGERQARCLKKPLNNPLLTFDAVLVSPLIRAQETCKLAELDKNAKIEPDLVEWNYGVYEGLTTALIMQTDSTWSIFTKGALGGESVEEIEKRADRVLKKAESMGACVALFTSGHISRVIMARWIGEKVQFGSKILSETASISILSYEHGNKVIKKLNSTCHYEQLAP